MKSPLSLSETKIRKYVSILPPSNPTSLPVPIFLSSRRSNPIPTSQPSSDNTLAVVTNDGFRQFSIREYFHMVSQVKDENMVLLPPIDLPLMLIPSGARGSGIAVRKSKKVGGNRARKLATRNEQWSAATLKKFSKDMPVLIPLIPGISYSQQQIYFDSLMGKEAGSTNKDVIDGLVVSDLSSPFLPELDSTTDDVAALGQKEDMEPTHDPLLTVARTIDYKMVPEELKETVRLDMAYQRGPHEVLRAIERGSDLVCGDWISNATDAGMGFSFKLPEDEASVHDGHEKKDYAIIFWDNEKYATDMSPIIEDCKCYTCMSHHRAYIAHLLNASEMLAWTLLQIHNIYTANEFMVSIRRAIKNGSLTTAATSFSHMYVEHMTGAKVNVPRARGYQVRLAGNTDKKSTEKGFRNLSTGA